MQIKPLLIFLFHQSAEYSSAVHMTSVREKGLVERTRIHCCGVKTLQPMRKSMWSCLKKLSIELLYDIIILFGGIGSNYSLYHIYK